MGFPFAAAIPIEHSALQQELLNGDVLTHPTDPNPVAMLLNGQGYWYTRNSGSVLEWTPQRPYQMLPLPDPLAIRIAAMRARDSGVELSIFCTGATDEKLDIYYQDVPQNGAVDLLQGWSLAETALPTLGQTQMTWTDQGDASRLPPAQTFMRVYLVGRQDTDANRNGLPDVREMLLTPAKLLETSGTALLLSHDFSDILDGWSVVHGLWKLTNGELEQENNAANAIIFWDQSQAFAWKDYVFETELRSTDDDPIGVVFYFQDPQNYYRFHLNRQNTICWLEKVRNGSVYRLACAPLGYEIDQTYHLRIKALFNTFEIDVDGVPVFPVPVVDTSFQSGTIGFYNHLCSDAFYNHASVSLAEKPDDRQPPSTPNCVKGASFSPHLAVLSWEAATDNIGVDVYEILRDNQPLGNTRQIYWFDRNVEPQSSYSYQLRAIDMLGNPSAFSVPVSINTPDGMQLLVEDFHEAVPASWTVVNGLWNVVDGVLEQGGNHSHALMYYNDPVAANWSDTRYTALAKSTDDDGLGLAFCFQNVSNYYRFSMNRQLQFFRLERILDGVRTTLAETTGGYDLHRWYLMQAEVIQGQITIRVNGADVFASVPDTKLTQGSIALYTHQCDDAYYGLVSVTAPNIPPDTQSPSTPQQVEYAWVGFSQLYLQWQPGTDNIGVEHYEIQRNGVPLATVNRTEFTDNDMQPETTYTYTVVAVDRAGNRSPASTPVLITTPAMPPLLMSADFDDNVMAPWTVSVGNWSITNGAAVQRGNNYKAFLYYNMPEAMDWADYTVSCNVRSTDQDTLGVAFCFQNRDNLYRFVMDRAHNSRRLEKMIHNSQMPNKLFCMAETDGGYEKNRNYLLQISIQNGRITVRLDGEDVFQRIVEDHTWTAGTVSLFGNICDGAYFDNVRVYAGGGMTDSDSDGIPDLWEVRNGLDPFLASDHQDADADGLVDFEEYRHGTDAQRADTDGDGMSDAWEVAYGLNPIDARDQGRDEDYDELTNIEEFRFGSNPMTEDQDLDGMPDLIECLGTMTLPTVSNAVTFNDVISATGAQASQVVGDWTVEGTDIIGQHIRGQLTWNVQVATPDVYRLQIVARELTPQLQTETAAPLRIMIDGAYVIRRMLKLQGHAPGAATCFTPWLSQGEHTITMVWDNNKFHSNLAISRIVLQEMAGADTHQDGVKDWVENWLRNRNTLNAPDASLVSPAFVEGMGSYVPLMHFTDPTLQPRQGLKDRWYADIPLQAAQATQVEARFENNGLARECYITWQPLDIMTAENITIRKGDALLLCAQAAGADPTTPVHLSLSNGSTFDTTMDTPIPCTFTQPGEFTVSGYIQDMSRSILVTVVEAAFDQDPMLWAGKFRDLDFSCLPPQAVLQLDNRIWMAPEWEQPETARGVRLTLGLPEERYAVARLSAEEGPILDSATLRGMQVYSSGQVYLRTIETYEDGTDLIEMGLVVTPMFMDMRIELRVYIGGLVFEDGSCIKILLPEDFDETGFATVRFLSSGVTRLCHKLSLYQENSLVGIR